MAAAAAKKLALAGRCALVTGATSGIGRATAIAFLEAGARVAATGRNAAALEEMKARGAVVICADLTEAGACQRVVEEAVSGLGGSLDTLVNCAGVLQGGAFGTEACSLDNFMFNFNANTKAVFEVMQHATPHLKGAFARRKEAGEEQDPSAIVNVTSVNGIHPFGGVASYCAAKAATEMLSRCAAVDLAPHGVRVNCVAPGVVETPLQRRGGMSDDAYEAFLKRSRETTHPLGAALDRIAQPEEVADLVVFLAGNASKFVTGTTVKIDGGRGCVGAR